MKTTKRPVKLCTWPNGEQREVRLCTNVDGVWTVEWDDDEVTRDANVPESWLSESNLPTTQEFVDLANEMAFRARSFCIAFAGRVEADGFEQVAAEFQLPRAILLKVLDFGRHPEKATNNELLEFSADLFLGNSK